MIDFNVIVQDASGNPVANAVVLTQSVALSGTSRYSDGGGFANFYHGNPIAPTTVDVSVFAAGFKPWTTGVNAIEFGHQSVTVNAVLDPSFKWPSRDQSVAVKAMFQGLRVDLTDPALGGYGVVPNPGAFVHSLNAAGRAKARATLRAALNAKPTEFVHDFRQVSYAYSEPGYTFPIPGRDFWQEGLDRFRDLLVEDLAAGVIPIIELAGDGPTYDSQNYADFGVYGFQWLIENLEELYDGIGTDVMRVCPTFGCWECITNGWGDNAPAMFEQCVLKQRSILSTGVIAAYLGGYTWWGDANPHSPLGPVGDWQSPVGLAIDVNFEEGQYPFLNPSTGEPLPRDNLNGWQQRATAHLDDPNLAIIAPQNIVQKEWLEPTPRGPRTSIANEYCTYQDDRGLVTEDDIARQRAYLQSLGFQYVS